VEKKERARLKSIKFQAKPEKVCDSLALYNGDYDETVLQLPAGRLNSLRFECILYMGSIHGHRCCFSVVAY